MNKLVLAAVAALLSLPASAAPQGMKPGLYDYKMKMEMPGMAYAMPEQSYQQCLTQADVDKGKQYQGQKGDCEMKNFSQSGGKVHYEMACKDGSTGTGDYAYTADGMTGKSVIVRGGHTMTMNMSATRAGDCTK